MQSVVAGTAGHIDHGKTSLVRALTGMETDRLEEEKRRGISIDLGFAHLRLSDNLRIAFIDVPGHERFIKNMLAGTGGIDMVLLVIAANESVKPQTREHFEICRLLHIPRGIVAITKIDTVDPEIVQLVRLEAAEFLAGSFLEHAPMVGVSAQTGEGVAELRTELAKMALQVPARETGRPFRMPVDRSFVMRGFGTVATGTVTSGSLAIDSDAELHPSGRRVRVRGIEVHGGPAKRASAGQRAALNLAGIDSTEVARGMVVAQAGAFRTTVAADCILDLLSSAKALKDRSPVHFHAGAAETVAEVRTLDRSPAATPGASTPVRLLFREPMLLSPGDRFIIRMFSPVITIGGGVVADPFPAARIRPGAAERARSLASADLSGRIARLASESGTGLSLAELTIRTGAAESRILENLPPSVHYTADPYRWTVDREWAAAMLARWRAMLAGFHRSNPLLPGIRKEELRSSELPDAPPFLFEFLLSLDRTIVASGDMVHLSSHKLALKQEEESALAKIESAFEQAGLSVPGLKEVLDASGVDDARARSLLQILFRQGRLVRVGDGLVFHPGALASVRGILESRRGARFSVPEFKDWTGISRKYAIPLLEYFDRERVTRRDGDARVIL